MNAIQSLLTGQLDIWTTAETEKKFGRGRSSGNGNSVYGIKKLRELILELAVRGKLVAQDMDDEPAGELLKRIRTEKTKLIAEGKIKKDKLLPPISDEEKPFELPQGWEWMKLGNLCRLENGDRSKNYPNKSVLVEKGIPFVNAGHLENGRINRDEMTFITQERYDLLRSGKFFNDDILYCLRGSLGKSAIVKSFDTGAIASSLVIIRIYPNLSHHYFVDYFDSPLSFRMIKKYDNGTAQPNLSATDLEKFLIPLPPLPEQHRIVAKVDELMVLCDQLETQHINAAEAHEKLISHLLGTLTQSQNADDFSANWQRIAAYFDTLFTTETSIDALKQTLLQLAVMGKLVPQDSNDESVSELLKRIQAEKAKLMTEGKIKKDKPLPPITEEEKPFELPQGWERARVGNLFEVTSGESFDISVEQDSGRYAYVKVGDMNLPENETVIKTSSRFVNPTEREHRGIIPANSVIFPKRGGAIATNKKRLVVSEIFVDLNIMAITVPKSISLLYAFQWLSGIDLALLNTGTSVPQINHKDIEPLIFPLPPLPEQHRIVAKVDELMALCDQLKSRITQASQLQQKLADVIVEQAIV